MRILDLFCGAGGLSLGFRKEGFNLTGVDISWHAEETFRANGLGEFTRVDLSAHTVEGDFDIILGGPPCKPWSSVNIVKRREKHRDYRLISSFFRHVECIRPAAFMVENVPPLRSDEILRRHIRRVRRRGYSVSSEVVRYSDYGAATSRRRLIVVGMRDGRAKSFFSELAAYRCAPMTVRDAIWNLRDRRRGEIRDHLWPRLKTIERYMKYYERNKYGWYILEWDKPAPSFGNIMKTYILHPDAFNGGETRVISVKEALMIMGFDEDFHFPEHIGLTARYQMVADAVSPVFSQVAAKVFRSILSQS